MERGNELRSPPLSRNTRLLSCPIDKPILELNLIICLDFLYLSVGEEIYETL
jgi:hypothetical protein